MFSMLLRLVLKIPVKMHLASPSVIMGLISKEEKKIMVLGLDEIKNRVAPIAKKYNLRAVYLFGSYARGEANRDSDIDLLIDSTGSTIKGLFDMGGLYNDLCEACGKSVDVVTTSTLEQPITKSRLPYFVNNLQRDKILIYG